MLGTAEPGLDFVAEEEDVLFPAEGLHSVQIVRGQGHHAALALHHFHQHGGRGGRDRGPESFQITGGHLLEALGQGREALAQAFAARGGQGPQGAAVEADAQGNDFIGVALLGPCAYSAGPA